MKRFLILHSKGVAPVAEQIEAAVRHGAKRRDLESDYGTAGVYVDKRMAGQATGYWRGVLFEQVEKGDIVLIFNLLIFGSTERAMREGIEAVHAKGGSVCLMATDATIKPSADLDRYFAEMRAAHDASGKHKSGTMNAARLAQGVKTGPKPRWSKEDQARVKEIWLISKSRTELMLRLSSAFSGRGPSYSQIWRWANPKPKEGKSTPRAWPPMGSGPKPVKPKPRKRRRSR